MLVCFYERGYGIKFAGPEPMFGNAYLAELGNGGRMSVRAPMHESENPVVRTYILVDDIEGAVKAAEDADATVIHPPLEIPGHGTFAICKTAETEHGFWQV